MASRLPISQGRNAQSAPILRASLLEWYDRNRRDLPWRRTRDPYAIWVSEIMLQQTRVAAVIDRYNSFMARFPTVKALAEASEQDVLAQWSGLGYYRRARMLQKAAQFVCANHQGEVPKTAEELRNLAGIGAYTAAAIASIAYGEHVAVVDGNVERVLSRLRGWESEDSKELAVTRRRVDTLATELVDAGRPGDFNQAVMELGALVCTPRNPQCLACPWARECRTLGEHKTPQKPGMTKREVGYALCVREGSEPGSRSLEVLFQQRAESDTVMPGMWELPALRDAIVPESELRITVRHAIMQVNYLVRVRSVSPEDLVAVAHLNGNSRWIALDKAAEMALTGLTRKVLSRVGLFKKSPPIQIAGIAAEPTADVL
jgi:A/G-specific adenine glycosylase